MVPQGVAGQTFRVSRLPEHLQLGDVASFLANLDPALQPASNIRVQSLATNIEPSDRFKTATVKFLKPVERLQSLPTASAGQWELSSSIYKRGVIIDANFLGLTVLNEPPENEHIVDCFAISGLASHPYGSWRSGSRDSADYMWLRDQLPLDLPGARCILWGYDSRLQDSKSIQIIQDIASNFAQVFRFCRGPLDSVKPTVFLAHSLGGLILKSALISLASCGEHEVQSVVSTVQAIMFFGVPSMGMKTAYMQAMVKGQANEVLVKELREKSASLLNLERRFHGISLLKNIRKISAYETEKSQTAQQDHMGVWSRSGPDEHLVDRDSAIQLGTTEADIFAINRSHSQMVKFTPNDPDYENVRNLLKSCCETISLPRQQFRAATRQWASTVEFPMEQQVAGAIEPQTRDDATALLSIAEDLSQRTVALLRGELRVRYVSGTPWERLGSDDMTIENFLTYLDIHGIRDWRGRLELFSTILTANFDHKFYSRDAYATEEIRFAVANGEHHWVPYLEQVGELEKISRQGAARNLKLVEIRAHLRIPIARALSAAVWQRYLEKFRSLVVQSLMFDEQTARYEQIDDASIRTFDWAFEDQIGLARWLEGGTGLFWIIGRPGSGKSTFMKYLCQHPRLPLLFGRNRNRPVITSFFFHDRGVLYQKSFHGLLRDLIHQIAQQEPIFLEVIEKRYIHRSSHEDENWSLSDLEACLYEIINYEGHPIQLLLMLDALDECHGSRDYINSLMKKLTKSSRRSGSTVAICFSSRHWPDFEEFLAYPHFHIHAHTRNDIAIFLRNRISNEPYLLEALRLTREDLSMSHPFLGEIQRRAQGVFLWVSLTINELSRAVRDGSTHNQKITDFLNKMPDALDEFYTSILDRVTQEYRLETYIMLEIVLRDDGSLSGPLFDAALRIAQVDDFQECQTLVWELLNKTVEDRVQGEMMQLPSSFRYSDQEMRNLRLFISSRCGGLIELMDTRASTDDSDSGFKIEFFHQTVKDYLKRPGGTDHFLRGAEASNIGNGHTILGKLYMTILGIRDQHLPVEIDRCIYHMHKAEATTGIPLSKFLDSVSLRASGKMLTALGIPSVSHNSEEFAASRPHLQLATAFGLELYLHEKAEGISGLTVSGGGSLTHTLLSRVKSAADVSTSLISLMRLLMRMGGNKSTDVGEQSAWNVVINNLSILHHEKDVLTAEDRRLADFFLEICRIMLESEQDPNEEVRFFVAAFNAPLSMADMLPFPEGFGTRFIITATTDLSRNITNGTASALHLAVLFGVNAALVPLLLRNGANATRKMRLWSQQLLTPIDALFAAMQLERAADLVFQRMWKRHIIQIIRAAGPDAITAKFDASHIIQSCDGLPDDIESLLYSRSWQIDAEATENDEQAAVGAAEGVDPSEARVNAEACGLELVLVGAASETLVGSRVPDVPERENDPPPAESSSPGTEVDEGAGPTEGALAVVPAPAPASASASASASQPYFHSPERDRLELTLLLNQLDRVEKEEMDTLEQKYEELLRQERQAMAKEQRSRRDREIAQLQERQQALARMMRNASTYPLVAEGYVARGIELEATLPWVSHQRSTERYELLASTRY